MIRLITGGTGCAKTLYLVAELLCKEYKDRPVYVLGVPELKLPHLTMPPIAQWTEIREVQGWQDQGSEDQTGRYAPQYVFPENSVIVIDEAQTIFRPRATTSKIPDHVAALETHRHGGIDFVLLTQHPSRIDKSVMTLVRHHQHLRQVWNFSRSIVYEWDEGQPNPRSIRTANKKVWKWDKSAYGLYKSSSLHVQPTSRPPYLFWLVLLMPLLVAAAGYMVYQRVKAHQSTTTTIPDNGTPLQRSGAAQAAVDVKQAPNQDMEPALRFAPKYPDEPQSAPAYEGMVTIVQVPRVAGCVSNARKCLCYTQQGTPLQVGARYCAEVAAGRVFDPYADKEQPVSSGQQVPKAGDKPSLPDQPQGQGPIQQVDIPDHLSPFERADRAIQAQG